MNRDIDAALAEIDLLAVADAVGVLRGGPIEPAPADWQVDQARAMRRARDKQRRITERRKLARPFEAWQGPDPEAGRREHANMLAALGFSIEYITHRFGITPRKENRS